MKIKNDNWLNLLGHNPIETLLNTWDKLLTFRVKRDILDEHVIKPDNSKEQELILKKQKPDGSWIFRSTSVAKYPSIKHNLIETFKMFRILVGKYELKRDNEHIVKAAEYIFSCQSSEGDIRGILGNQYMPYYCGLLLELLIKAGYENDFRIDKAFKWLVGNRQTDGGWVIPLQTVKVNKLDDATYASPPIRADINLPSSHLATGMVLRAFSSHPKYKTSETALKAANFLKSRFFKPDKYNDRKKPEYWTKLKYPYWWTTIVSSLDSLYHLGYTTDDEDVLKVIEWILINQKEDGLWGNIPGKGNIEKYYNEREWISYDICRILKLYLG